MNPERIPLMDAKTRRRLLRESNFGRDFGWWVEWNGRAVARLDDPVWDSNSQFWFHYRLTLTTTDPAERAALLDKKFWDAHISEITFRSIRLGEVAVGAFTSERVFDENGRVWTRGLHLSDEPD
jgi:hypothetical protein